MYKNVVKDQTAGRGRRQRSPYAWLGAGVVGLGVGVGVALAGGAGVAHADTATARDASSSASSSSASSRSASAGAGRAARDSGAATARRHAGSASSVAPDRSVVAAARPAAVVKPAAAQLPSLLNSAPPVSIPAPTVADGQAQIANSFNDVPKVTASSVATASAPKGWLGQFLWTFNPNPSKGTATTKVPRAAASRDVGEGTDANFATIVLNSKRPVLVDFTAAWCGPCKRLAPITEAVADDLLGRVTVVKVDIDDAPGLATQYEIRSVPTILVFSGGVVVGSSVGLTSKAKLIELVAKYL